jgi:site-specific DNA-methyltransferase (adenine-specific)
MAYNDGMQRTTADPTWETPQWLFDYWAARFQFSIDVCAVNETTKCEEYFSPERNGLIQDWDGETCWMNPPYGREIVKWCKKAADEADNGAVVVGLIPARTDTGWWHDHVIRASRIYFLRGRIQFDNCGVNAPFPNAVVVWAGVSPAKVEWLDLRNYR